MDVKLKSHGTNNCAGDQKGKQSRDHDEKLNGHKNCRPTTLPRGKMMYYCCQKHNSLCWTITEDSVNKFFQNCVMNDKNHVIYKIIFPFYMFLSYFDYEYTN